MRRIWIVFLFLGFTTACSLLVDFEPKCHEQYPDCRLGVCASHPACTPRPCSRDIMYYDSPPSLECGEDARCFYRDGSYGCVPASLFPDDDSLFYNRCSPDIGEGCPYGAICVNSIGNSFCLPYCNLDTHPNCPKPGKCYYARGSESEFDICVLQQDCNPVDGSACKQKDMACYFSFDLSNNSLITICTPPGSVSAYQQCEMPWDCIPGHICTDGNGSLGTVKRCIPLCDGKHPCKNNRETCIFIMGTTGICDPGISPVSLFP